MKKFKLRKIIKEVHLWEAEVEANSKEEAEEMLKNDSNSGIEHTQLPGNFLLIDTSVEEIG